MPSEFPPDAQPRTIVVDQAEAQTRSYTLPAGTILKLEAIRAAIDAVGSSSPLLTITAPGGAVIARKRQGEAITAGTADGSATWALRLDDEAAGASPAATVGGWQSPIVVPLIPSREWQHRGFRWNQAEIAADMLSGEVLHNTNTGAVNDYFTRKVVLGPFGSIWGLGYTYRQRTNGGTFKVQMGSVAEPDPSRGGSDDAGTWSDQDPTYIDVLGATRDTYNAVQQEGSTGGPFTVFRIMGAEGDPLTAFDNNGDPFTGFDTIDGGPGAYELKFIVTGKNAASSGFRCDLGSLFAIRVDDLGFV